MRQHTASLSAGLVAALVVALAAAPGAAQAPSAAVQGFERLKALHGDWIDVDGAFGDKGKVAVTYRVTGGGHTVVETFPVGTPYEMVTVYHLEGDAVVLTHYCNQNTQPRMRSTGLQGTTLAFDYAGGTNIGPQTSHMHSVRMEFLSADELRATWQNWKAGQAAEAPAPFRIIRQK
jgi:hypothetical protein